MPKEPLQTNTKKGLNPESFSFGHYPGGSAVLVSAIMKKWLHKVTAEKGQQKHTKKSLKLRLRDLFFLGGSIILAFIGIALKS